MENYKSVVILKAFFLAAAAVYFFGRAADRQGYGFLDNVDLVIHEAGHAIFSFGGEFIAVAGGTTLQLLLPLVFVLYFWRRRELYSAAIISFWLGQSFVNVARYAADAAKMELPLLGGGSHDWNYLLLQTGLIMRAQSVSDFFYYSGAAVMVAGLAVGVIALNKDFYETKKGNL